MAFYINVQANLFLTSLLLSRTLPKSIKPSCNGNISEQQLSFLVKREIHFTAGYITSIKISRIWQEDSFFSKVAGIMGGGVAEVNVIRLEPLFATHILNDVLWYPMKQIYCGFDQFLF